MTHLRQMIRLAMGFALACLICGCNPSATETAASKQIVRWKACSKSAAMGLVLEKEGRNITATLYDLSSCDGFAINKELAAGKYLPGRKAFILIPSGVPLFASIDEWVEMNGTRFEVPLGKSGTNLIATFKSPGLPEMPTEFLRFRE